MWETTIKAERSQVVAAPLDRVWALLSSPEAWSLRRQPGFMFDVPQPRDMPQERPLRGFMTSAGGGVFRNVVFEVIDGPGELMCLRTRSTDPVGKQEVTMSALSTRRGTAARIAVSAVAPRAYKVQHEGFWRDGLKSWLKALAAVAEDRAPRPSTGMPARIQQACAARRDLEHPVGVSAEVVIGAPVEAVWQAVHSPHTDCMMNPPRAVCAGFVPGTPRHQPGEMQYFIRPGPNGRLHANTVVVRELSELHSALTQRIGPPHDEMLHQVEPAAGGTLLVMTCRVPALALVRNENLRAAIAAELQAAANGYQAVIETAVDRPKPA